MPTAPSYGQQRVAPAGVPGARLTAAPSPETFGAGIGDKAAKVGAQIYELERDKADEQAVYEFRRSLNDWELGAIYDPKTGAISRKGRDAFDLPERLAESYDKHVSEASKGLSTDRQRSSAQRLAEARRQQVMEWGQKHVAVEREKFHVEQFAADVESSQERASRNPNLAAGEIAVQRKRVMDFFNDRGASPEVIQQKLQAAETGTHARVVESLLAGGAVTEAAKWLETNRERMDPDTVTKLQMRLKPAADQAIGLAVADDIDKTMPGATTDQAREKIQQRTADNPNAYKVAMAEWEHRRGVRERDAALINRKNDQAVDGFMAQVYAKGRAPSVAELQSLPEFKAMDGTQQLQAIDKARNIMRGLRSEGERAVKTDIVALGNALENLADLSTADIAALRGISNADKEQLMRQGIAMRNGTGKYNTGQATTIFNTTFLAATDKKKISDLPQPEKERLGNLMSTFTARVEEFAAELPKGKKVTSEEMQRIADDMFIRGEDPTRGITVPFLGTFGRPQVFRGEALPGASFSPRKAEKVTEIPYGIRREISRGLADAGKPVTEAAIVETYNSAIERRAPATPKAPGLSRPYVN